MATSRLTFLLLLWQASTLAVIGVVRVEEQMEQVVVDEGKPARFVCKTDTHPSSSGRLKLQWKHKGRLLNVSRGGKYVYQPDGGQHVLTVKDVAPEDAGTYTCIASLGLDMDMASAQLTVRSPPEPPKDVQVISCVAQTAELVWTPGEEKGAALLGYQVQFNSSQNRDAWFDYYDIFPPRATTGFVELSPWGTYTFRVVAKSDVGNSQPSSTTARSCTTPPDRPDTNPKNVRARTDKKNMLVIEWTPMHTLHHHGPGFRYHVYWRPKGSTYWKEDVVNDPEVGFYQVEVNDIYGCYEFKVKAENDLGVSYQREYIYVGHSGEAEPIVSPKDFRIDPTHPVQPHTAHFIWEAVDVSEDKIRGKFHGYQLRYWKSSEGRYKQHKVDIVMEAKTGDHGPDVRVALDNLPPYTALRAQVAVKNTHYTGPPSQTIDFSTPEGVPGPVRDLHQEAIGMSFVLLKWLPPVEPNGILMGYDIGYQPVKGLQMEAVQTLRPQITNPSTLGARITGLKPDHQYRFYVWARTKAGKGDPAFLDVRTADGEREKGLYRSANTPVDPTDGSCPQRSCHLLLPLMLLLVVFLR